jgi:hypothetical protein
MKKVLFMTPFSLDLVNSGWGYFNDEDTVIYRL